MKKLLAVILCWMLILSALFVNLCTYVTKEESGSKYYLDEKDTLLVSNGWQGTEITGEFLSLFIQDFKKNGHILKKMVAEYKATHTKCDYCEKEFLTSELKEFIKIRKSGTGTYYTQKRICSTCKANLKAECEAMGKVVK